MPKSTEDVTTTSYRGGCSPSLSSVVSLSASPFFDPCPLDCHLVFDLALTSLSHSSHRSVVFRVSIIVNVNCHSLPTTDLTALVVVSPNKEANVSAVASGVKGWWMSKHAKRKKGRKGDIEK